MNSGVCLCAIHEFFRLRSVFTNLNDPQNPLRNVQQLNCNYILL